MFISNIYFKNYKSLHDVNIKLHEGKNVIVGKNNSGKSNIIHGLDILFNEKSPVYRNFDENDFYTHEVVDEGTGEITEKIAKYFFICATIEGRDFTESEILSIVKSTAFSRLISTQALSVKINCIDEINVDFLTNLDVIEQSKFVDNIALTGKNGSPYTSKILWLKAPELLQFLKDLKTIKLFFCKTLKGESGFGIIGVDKADKFWVSHFLSNKLRDSLITTAIIPSFRNPKDELRLTYYTWYGKLIKNLWDKGKTKVEKDIIEKTNEIRLLADEVFHENTVELKELLKKAISHESVSFRLINNKNFDLYKSVNIHINDGIDRPIEQKGSGIQSAIIISLFTSYCSQFHNTSSLLIAEEPELFLHPQARRVISNELEKYLVGEEKQKRQLIISTHSTEFIRNVDISNIIILRKDIKTNSTQAFQINIDEKLSEEEINKIIRFIWSKNTELFFADKVILVEGGEEYLVPQIIDSLKNEKCYLDYRNISIARVDGKGNFLTYIKILKRFGIPFLILGDLDCYEDIVLQITNEINPEISPLVNAFKSKIPTGVNYKKLNTEIIKNTESLDAKKLHDLFQGIKSGEINLDNENLIQLINYMEERFAKNNIAEFIEGNQPIKEEFKNLQGKLREQGLFILSKGAIEEYYTEKVWYEINTSGKDNRALIVGGLISDDLTKVETYIKYLDEWKELIEIL